MRSEPEIRATLDGAGALEGLPFMDEMRRHCGRRYRVAGSTGRICVEGHPSLRRLENAVILDGDGTGGDTEDLRCDGASHGGCARGCRLIWKEAWLERSSDTSGDEKIARSDGEIRATDERCTRARARPIAARAGEVLHCQSTELLAASVPLPIPERLARLAEVARGDVRPAELFAAVVSALGNRVRRLFLQSFRDGGPAGEVAAALALAPGETARVRSLRQIARTLDGRHRTRGLELSPGMPAHCGGRYRVRRRVERIILEASGQVREIADTVILDGVECDGCVRRSEHFWREDWLERDR